MNTAGLPSGAFHNKNRLSFQADRLVRSGEGGRTNAGRIVLELSQDSGQRVFAFLLDRSGIKDLAIFTPPLEILRDALNGVANALALPDSTVGVTRTLGNAVALDGDLPVKVRAQMTSDDWYNTRLTAAQRRFVDHPHTGSVRLVGPAGTGKTVALVVKCLRELITAQRTGEQKRFLFLTHASKTATDIENIVLSMEPDLGIELLASDKPELVITTLYALANRQMRYDLDELTPVSLDGHEGREFQADVLNEAIEQYRRGDWIAYRSGCTDPFAAYMERLQEGGPERDW